MYLPVEHFLIPLWNRWVIRGGKSRVAQLSNPGGWRLGLSRRAKVGAWLIFVEFAAVGVGAIAAFLSNAMPQREALLVLLASAGFNTLTVYHLLYVYWYRVELTRDGVTLFRALLPKRRIAWDEIDGMMYQPGEDQLLLECKSKKHFKISAFLDGLWALRWCLWWNLWNLSAPSMQGIDLILETRIPSWRCPPALFDCDPFDTDGHSKPLHPYP